MSDALDLLESNRKFHIERGKLNLATFQAQVDAEVDLLKARGDFMIKLQEVVALQIKNEKDFVQLTWLHLQAREYRRALADAKRRLTKAQKRQKNLQFAVVRAGWLAAGEALDPGVVSVAWGAFFALVSNLPFNARLELTKIPITAEIRRGNGFIRPRYPGQACEDVPESIGNALQLLEWARARSYVPKAHSAVQGLLAVSLAELATRSEEALLAVKAEVAFAEELLRTRREILWKEGVTMPSGGSVTTKASPKSPPSPTLPQDAPSETMGSTTSPKKASSAKKTTTKNKQEPEKGVAPSSP
ncbi:MAG: hypothetical protein JNK90_07660 [Planctomycetaceae bacterium]|nr:hypothetical protein [Planctomycetaceae bacterium]